MNVEIEDIKINEVDISPEISMYNLLESYPYNLGSALSEYIDNSIQSFLDNREKLYKEKINVTITVDFSDKSNKKIIIEDDGAGITYNNLKRAMKPAFKPNEQNLNEFGIGMKAASIWIGRKWTLTNSQLNRKNSNECQKIVFDLNELIIKNKGIIPIVIQNNGCCKNGVKITIEDLVKDFDKNQVEDAFLTLQENYQYFINIDKILNLHLIFSENKNLPSLADEATSIPKILVSPKMIIKKNIPYWENEVDKVWKKDVNFEFNGKIVHGFVMCRETSSYKNPGVKIFRQKRLIKGTVRNPNYPIDLLDTANKRISIRFYAELHLDGQKISNNKMELNINEKLLYTILQEQEGVQDILNQARDYQADKVKKNLVEVYKEFEDLKNESTNKNKEDKKTEITSNKDTKTVPAKYTDVLDTVIKNTKDLIVQNIALEAKKLYIQSNWGFILCYRVIAERIIQEKIKQIDILKYNKDNIANKGIVELVKWLANNKGTLNFNDTWKSLDKSLNQINGSNKFEITNLVGHGHYYPTKQEIDILIINTQKLLEWAVSSE
ncbi:ATP-binding protein [Aliarcobacter butzleri]|uniref:ATP-binding protein n=1 Tax=Aliarcobacter butzleri TaxID=28197 RepID=A0AAW7Q3Y3_9BACT|nr:ATP-binding protein [Aliarcobacter butzleri]MDN5114182.1 ATP-binding protein [Aliarcobacter butzleri]